MINKKLVLSAVVAIFCSQVTYAMLPRPLECPTSAEIQAKGITTQVVEQSPGKWIALQPNQKYGTLDTWTFAIGEYSAKSAEEAYKLASESLAPLQYKYGPKFNSNVWYCAYRAGPYVGVTVTPSEGVNSLMSNISHL